MKVTIEVNSLNELHGVTETMSEIELKIAKEISKKAPREIHKHETMIEYHRIQVIKLLQMKEFIDDQILDEKEE